MLSLLPAELEAVRASQDKMIEREEKLEKKRKPTSTVTSSEVTPKKVKIVEDTKENTKEETKLDKKIGGC